MNQQLVRYKSISRAIILALVIFCLLAASCGGGAGGGKRIGAGYWPSWSPDGSKILFYQRGIYMMDPDGSHRMPVLPTPSGAGPLNFGSNAWSPDGERIVYAAASCLFTLGVDGTNPTKVTGEPSPIERIFAPSWSPDGSKIVFESHIEGPGIHVVDIDGGNETRLTPEGVDDRSPAWSPDGSKIAFVSWRDGGWEIYVMNADGSNPTRLTESIASDGYPAWSPDGSKIAFTSERDDRRDIYIMNADGSNVTRLTNDSIIKSSPSWSPDGTKIAFSGYHPNDPEAEGYIYLANVRR
jgi:Tol biopolymer transport system component